MKYYATITYNESGLYYVLQVTFYRRNTGGYYTDGKDRPCLIELNVITNYNYNISGEVFGRELTIMDKALGL